MLGLGKLGRLGVSTGVGSGGGRLEITFGSGKKFPVWGTVSGDNKVKSFKILGYTAQDGTPTPETPVPLLSVGDNGLTLCVSDTENSTPKQIINFPGIVLRSLPDGTCDSLEWDNNLKKWKYIQRINSYKFTKFSSLRNDETYNFTLAGVSLNIVGEPYIGGLSSICEIMQDIFTADYYSGNITDYRFYMKFPKGITLEESNDYISSAIPVEVIYKLAEPIKTILDLPAPQTFSDVTYFGTPTAEIKPYMICECKVKKALKYQGEISAWWYFDGNKSNETERQIIDLSGNGNDLTPMNYAWNRESGWNQGSMQQDGIDDIANVTMSPPIAGILYNGVYESGSIQLDIRENTLNRFSIDKNRLTVQPGSINAEKIYGDDKIWIINASGVSENAKISLSYDATYLSKQKIYELLIFANNLTLSEAENNYKVAQQRNGIAGDMDFSPASIPGCIAYFEAADGDNNSPTRDKWVNRYSDALESGNIAYFLLSNFEYNEESGFKDGYLYFDGIDDFGLAANQDGTSSKNCRPFEYPDGFTLFAQYEALDFDQNGQLYNAVGVCSTSQNRAWLGISTTDNTTKTGIIYPSSGSYNVHDSDVKNIAVIGINADKTKGRVALNEYDLTGFGSQNQIPLGLGWFRGSDRYLKFRLKNVILYNRYLSEEEIKKVATIMSTK